MKKSLRNNEHRAPTNSGGTQGKDRATDQNPRDETEMSMQHENTEIKFAPKDALVAIMVAVSESDENFEMSELKTIERIVNNLPIFSDYDPKRIGFVSQTVFMLLEENEGINALFGLVKPSLPSHLAETAYVYACDVAAADGRLGRREIAFLDQIRENLELDPLVAEAIHRSSRARYATL